MKIYKEEDKNMILDLQAELYNIEQLKIDIMAIYCVDEYMAIYQDRYTELGLLDLYNNAMLDSRIFKDKYYWYYYDVDNDIIDIDNIAFYDFLESLEGQLKGVYCH